MQKTLAASLSVLLIASMLVIPLCTSPLYLRTVNAEEFSNSTHTNSTFLSYFATLANSASANSINGTLSYQNNINNEIPLLNSESLKNSITQGDVKVKNDT